jgi:uncharacterized heparinase superfamily protein
MNAAAGAPTFLNRTLRIADGTDVNWYDSRFDELPGDWAFKLYGFDPLAWVYTGVEPDTEAAVRLQRTFDGWIRDWGDSVHIGERQYLRRAWTPWAVSLRIIRWCRYLAWRTPGAVDNQQDFEAELGRALYKNALFLTNHIERDVGGNHLIENGAALVLAGVVLSVDSWITTGVELLSEAATEQFLNDGCHFERSPMYHVLVLTRYLTVQGVLLDVGHSVPASLRETVRAGLAFLRFIAPPDDRLPLLNDSVYGQGLPLSACLRYAGALGLPDESPSGGVKPSRCHPTESGYHWRKTTGGAMLIDGGPVGPPHLPGHSHSDTLSVLVWLDGCPVVTDTGTFGYEAGAFRQYARGVNGHNTVQVGTIEPIPLSGKFLLGPRCDPEIRAEDGPVSVFEGRYTARPFGSTPYTHHRAVYTADDWWTIWDTVDCTDDAPVYSRLHLHPEITPTVASTGRISLTGPADTPLGFVHPLGETRTRITTGWYFPEFGKAVQRPVLEVEATETQTERTALGLLLTHRALHNVAVDRPGPHRGPDGLHVDARVQLPPVRLRPE